MIGKSSEILEKSKVIDITISCPIKLTCLSRKSVKGKSIINYPSLCIISTIILWLVDTIFPNPRQSSFREKTVVNWYWETQVLIIHTYSI